MLRQLFVLPQVSVNHNSPAQRIRQFLTQFQRSLKPSIQKKLESQHNLPALATRQFLTQL
jgi:hypothetical protein